MLNPTPLEYAFVRTEANDNYVLFLKIEPSFLEQDVDINLNDTNQLVLSFANGQTLITSKLEDNIYEVLAYRQTLTIFTDEDGLFIANHVLDPLLTVSTGSLT